MIVTRTLQPPSEVTSDSVKVSSSLASIYLQDHSQNSEDHTADFRENSAILIKVGFEPQFKPHFFCGSMVYASEFEIISRRRYVKERSWSG